MAENDQEDSEKTEEPSPRKLEKAARRGEVPLSREARSFGLLLAGLLLVLFYLPFMMKSLGVNLVGYIEHPHDLPFARAELVEALTTTLLTIAALLGAFAVPLIAMLLLSTWIQVGLVWAREKKFFNAQAINPITGLKRRFSAQSLVEFAKSLAKIIMVGIVGVVVLIPLFRIIDDFAARPLMSSLESAREWVLWVLAAVLAVYLVVVVADVLWTRFSFTKKQRMTRQELRDEQKQTEGDPHVRRRIARLRQERHRSILSKAIERADVLVTNPTHYAVALEYKPEEHQAPILVAKGIDYLALRMRELAEANDVPIVENPPLARALYASGEVDQEIAPEHYQVVAEVISYVWKLKNYRPPESPNLAA